MNKSKAVKYRRIQEDTDDGKALYAELRGIIIRHHKRRNLDQARFALVWQYDIEPDQDDRIVLGKCRKASDFDKEFSTYDFVVILNRDAWERLDPPQRRALMDHELCHAAPVMNTDGTQKEDDRGRRVWRIRKHDIEEFAEIVTRHGCWKQDLEAFVRAAMNSPTLFDPVDAPTSTQPGPRPPVSPPKADPPPPPTPPPAAPPADETITEPEGDPDEEPLAGPIEMIDDVKDKALFMATSKPAGASDVWRPLIQGGATMQQIAEALNTIWRETFTWPPAGEITPRAEACVCQGRPPRAWIGVEITEPPTLAGAELVAAVRRLLSIGEPAAEDPPSPGQEIEALARQDPEHWRHVRLDTLDGLPRKIVEKLAEANLITLGNISDYLAPGEGGYCKRLTDIPGIGEAKAQQIEDAMARFWAKRNQSGAA